jgi:hypothetical protein
MRLGASESSLLSSRGQMINKIGLESKKQKKSSRCISITVNKISHDFVLLGLVQYSHRASQGGVDKGKKGTAKSQIN